MNSPKPDLKTADPQKDKDKDKETETKVNATSDLEALIHVIKSSLGTGILAIPNGFLNGGILFSLVGTIIIGIICTHCTYIMVACSQEMCRRLEKPFLGYHETVVVVFEHCAEAKYKKFASIARVFAEAFIFFTYFGANTVYILLVAGTLEEILEYHYKLHYAKRIYILMVSLPIYFVGIVRTMKHLTPFSVIANLLLLTGLSITFYYLFIDMPSISSRPYIASIGRIPIFFATVVFGMEGIGTMLPIENSMKTPEHFLGLIGVLTIAMCVVVFFFMTLGFFGYLKYGDLTKGSVTLNLPDDGLAETVKALVALAVFFTYGLQMTASVDVVWKRVENKFSDTHKDKAYYIVRSSLIIGTVLLAIAVPTLPPIISLIGSFGLSMCGLFIPAVVDTLVIWDNGYGFLKWKLWKNGLLCIIALLSLTFGTVISMQDIIKNYF